MTKTQPAENAGTSLETETPLWTVDHLVAASEARIDGSPPDSIAGLSIDTRTLTPGALFVALKDQRDGHEYVSKAFEAGAAAALVSDSYERQPQDGALLRVAEPLRALENIGRAARARLGSDARAIAVTGSVGKTGTKEMLRAAFQELGPTHAAAKSFNNHFGVPLTLAHMPASTRYGIFEIGMNHAGEITPLTGMVRPHLAIITTVEAVHIEHFPNVEAIADAKAEIFSGLVPGGVAVLNIDNQHYERLEQAAKAQGARIVSFGFDKRAMVRATEIIPSPTGTTINAQLDGADISYRVGTPGRHIVQNSLSVAATLWALETDVAEGLAPLAALQPPPGRGSRTELDVAGGQALLIDESYNANPASMRAALTVLAELPRSQYGRRIAVLGDMLELGADAVSGHEGLASAVEQAAIDVLYTVGPNMAHLHARAGASRQSTWTKTASEIEEALLAVVQPGDVIMIKGSNGSRMAPLAQALRTRFGASSM